MSYDCWGFALHLERINIIQSADIWNISTNSWLEIILSEISRMRFIHAANVLDHSGRWATNQADKTLTDWFALSRRLRGKPRVSSHQMAQQRFTDAGRSIRDVEKLFMRHEDYFNLGSRSKNLIYFSQR